MPANRIPYERYFEVLAVREPGMSMQSYAYLRRLTFGRFVDLGRREARGNGAGAFDKQACCAESIPAVTSSEGTSYSCSSATLNPSRLVGRILKLPDLARMASTKSATASHRCSQLSNTNKRTLPSSAVATLSATLLPGC